MKANPNIELLEGMQCPRCGNFGPFKIRTECTVLVSDDGIEDISNCGGNEWDDTSNCACSICDHAGQVKDFTVDEQPLQIRIGSYSVCMDVDEDGDLQLRVYPIDKDGQTWDSPFDTFDVLKNEIDALSKEGAP